MNQEQAIIQPARLAATVLIEPNRDRDGMLRYAVIPLVLLLLAGAWAIRQGGYYEPGDDFGYYLGVIGGIMMLTLPLYSMRKHFRFMHNWGASKHWFRLHMFLGITGPTLILFHSTFRVGAVNSAVALYCMLLVAGSGVVGRFIYRKIHHGLYGRSTTLQEIQTRLGISQGEVKSKFHFALNVEKYLKAFEARALSTDQGACSRTWLFLTVGLRARWTQYVVGRELDRAFRVYAGKHGWDTVKYEKRLIHGKSVIQAHLNAVVDVSRFREYERLFSLWHILHVPFVFMLEISGVVHVIAVHMY